MSSKIVGLVGYTKSGKDTLGDILSAEYKWKSIAFAQPVRDMLVAIDPVYLDNLQELEYCKRRGLRATREKLQRLGKYMRDTEGEDFWIKKAFDLASPEGWSWRLVKGEQKIFLCQDALEQNVLIKDIRHHNEFDAVKRSGGLTLAITRDGCGPVNNDVTEQMVLQLQAQCDFELPNNGTPQAMVATFLDLCAL